MSGIYDSTMTEIERRCVYDEIWTRRMDEWIAAYRRKDTTGTDAAWEALKAREAELVGDSDGR